MMVIIKIYDRKLIFYSLSRRPSLTESTVKHVSLPVAKKITVRKVLKLRYRTLLGNVTPTLPFNLIKK